jgi:uncharacterized protein (DUF1800 family)
MSSGDPLIEHLLRRAGFGGSASEIQTYSDLGYATALDTLINYEQIFDNVDDLIGQPGYVGMTIVGPFTPATNIAHARQRWLFRMVHTPRPLQEKMTLFWHNHFATAFSKVAGTITASDAARVMASKPGDDGANVEGQIELFRRMALGNFRDLVLGVAKDVAMLIWLDGRTNVKAQPQENFARELMELFTFGVGHYTETDVYAGARVFTGWNMSARSSATDPNGTYKFQYNANQHDTNAKGPFSFPIYPDGSKTIPARSASAGLQDGVDLINAVVAHRNTGPRLAQKLYAFFVNEVDPPDASLINAMAADYYNNSYEIKPMLIRLFTSSAFTDPAIFFRRYSWPAEFVARAIKEMGWTGFSVNDALNPMITMDQQLFEPPNVAGWSLGESWFTSGSMLGRMNFAAALAANQKFNLRNAARGFVKSPENVVSWSMDRMTPAPFDNDSYNALLTYARAGDPWTGSDAQLATKTSGVAHLIAGSGEYQLV